MIKRARARGEAFATSKNTDNDINIILIDS